MPVQQIAPGLFQLPVSIVNVFFLQSEDGWALIDAAVPDSAGTILAAFKEMGHAPAELRHIVVTHAHPDHIGSLAALKRATGAAVYIHPLDAPVARGELAFRPIHAAPGLMTQVMFRLFIRPAPPAEAAVVDHEVNDGDVLPIAGGLTALHTPGHSSGHLAFLWPRHQVLIAGDTCSNMPSLGWSLGYEDLETGRRSLTRLAKLDFETACFGHGQAIPSGAARRFRAKWGQA